MVSFKIPLCIEEAELIKILNDRKVKKHHKFAFALGFYECMRVSEIVKLRLEDVDFNTKLIKVVQGKGGKDRMIPIAPEVFHKGIRTYIPLKCKKRALQAAFKNACKRILGKDYHFHTLRHGGISHYINNKKWSSLQVQRLAGHSRIDTTEIYTHVKPSDLLRQMWGEQSV